MAGQNVHIVAARRTPVGALNGGLVSLAAHELGTIAITAAIADAGLEPARIDETILGQVLTAGQGMNPARQAARAAGLADSAPALSVNQVCGSGLRAIALAGQQIALGEAEAVVAGGQESMSRAPHVATLRQGQKRGDITFTDTVMSEGLSDAFYGYPMGATAENVAKQYLIEREAQDAFALTSHQRASAAEKAGRFATEIVPVSVKTRKGETIVSADEFIRHDADLATMQKLKPAFDKDGTVTAGNASGINDGAAAVVLMSESALAAANVTPLARIASWAHVGLDPQVMGLGPIGASRKALERAGWTTDSVDLWEINEAFASQSLAVMRDLELDAGKVNVNGGAIALGHPIGASGARVLTTLIHEMNKRDARRGVATLCIGGGMGIAMCIARD